MKKVLLTIAIALLAFSPGKSSHLYGGELVINHISGFNYEIKAVLYTDMMGVQFPTTIIVNSYSKASNSLMGNFTLPKISGDTVPQLPSSCFTGSYLTGIITYSDTVLLDSGYSNPAGYLFSYSNCCLTGTIVNLTNPSSNGITIALDFPGTYGILGQIINSSPTWSPIFPDVACSGVQKTLTNQAYDPDGDSLAYEFYAPFSGSSPAGGTFSSVSFNPGYSVSNPMVNISLNSTTGDITINPTNVGAHAFGVKASEYRNGVFIGASYRQYHMVVVNCNSSAPPSSSFLGVNPPGSSVSGNTLTFIGSPAEIIFEAWDPNYDPVNANTLNFSTEISGAGWVPGTATLSATTYPTTSATDTITNFLMLSPAGFNSNSFTLDILTSSNGCGNPTDTLRFDVSFINYATAGGPGSTIVTVVNSGTTVDLFTHLTGNPDPGGVWHDDDNTGGLNGGILTTDNIPDGTYRYTYEVSAAGYPNATSYVDVTVTNTILSLNDLNTANELVVYPNPSKGVFSIKIPSNAKAEFLGVYDILGKMILKLPVNSETMDLDFSDFPRGIYHLEIKGESSYKESLILN